MDAQLAAAQALNLWTALGVIAVLVVQLFYLAFRFGQLDARLKALEDGQRGIWQILNSHIKL